MTLLFVLICSNKVMGNEVNLLIKWHTYYCYIYTAQTQGLGTALKILFSQKLIENMPESGPSYGFQLTRQEIVSFFNAFGRLV